MTNKILYAYSTRSGDCFSDMIISHTVRRTLLSKKFTGNYKINIYMTHGTLDIYIYDMQHL